MCSFMDRQNTNQPQELFLPIMRTSKLLPQILNFMNMEIVTYQLEPPHGRLSHEVGAISCWLMDAR